MGDFTGMTVKVTLKQPPNTILFGKVKEVVAGQTLSLQDVVFQHSGVRWDQWTVQGAVIAELEVVDTSAFATSARQSAAGPMQRGQSIPSQPSAFPSRPSQPPTELPTQSPQRAPAAFVDPAILSYRPSPSLSRDAAKPVPPAQGPALPATPVKPMLAKAIDSLPRSSSSPFVGEARGLHTGPRQKDEDVVMPSAPPSLQQRSLSVPQSIKDAAGQDHGQGDAGKKKVRRGQKKKAAPTTSEEPQVAPQVMNIDVSRNGNDMNGTVKRGKGWRNTPLLQPSLQSSPVINGKGSVRGSKTGRQRREADQNGWATEDATDVQDMGEFDFEANHKLFDKKAVFEELKAGDTTADEDRLVSHNRHRPGTYGGKNLHPTENVLSPTLAPKKYGSQELESSSDADTEQNFGGGRSSSRHSLSRASLKKRSSRQNSHHTGDTKPHPLTASVSSDRGLGISKNMPSLATRGKTITSTTTSPLPERTQSPHSILSAPQRRRSPAHRSATEARDAHFLLPSSGVVCPVLHPYALDLLEHETVSRYGVAYDAITESAARAIAETSMQLIESQNASGSRRGSRAANLRGSIATTSSRSQGGLTATLHPVIVLLAGDHATGARALAAARQLVSRRCRLIIAEASYESPESNGSQLAAQTAIIKRLVKGGATIKRGPWKKASQYIKQLSGPPAVIIDALCGGTAYEQIGRITGNAELNALRQRETREMIDWANRSRAPVLSVGCPSGVSGIDGSATVVDGEPLAIRPEKVLALGLPVDGLLEAMKSGEKWDVALADIGINIALRAEEAVAFGSQWVCECKFVEDSVLDEGAQ